MKKQHQKRSLIAASLLFYYTKGHILSWGPLSINEELDMVVLCFLLGSRDEHFNKHRALCVYRFVCVLHMGIKICTVQAPQSPPSPAWETWVPLSQTVGTRTCSAKLVGDRSITEISINIYLYYQRNKHNRLFLKAKVAKYAYLLSGMELDELGISHLSVRRRVRPQQAAS